MSVIQSWLSIMNSIISANVMFAMITGFSPTASSYDLCVWVAASIGFSHHVPPANSTMTQGGQSPMLKHSQIILACFVSQLNHTTLFISLYYTRYELHNHHYNIISLNHIEPHWIPNNERHLASKVTGLPPLGSLSPVSITHRKSMRSMSVTDYQNHLQLASTNNLPCHASNLRIFTDVCWRSVCMIGFDSDV